MLALVLIFFCVILAEFVTGVLFAKAVLKLPI